MYIIVYLYSSCKFGFSPGPAAPTPGPDQFIFHKSGLDTADLSVHRYLVDQVSSLYMNRSWPGLHSQILTDNIDRWNVELLQTSFIHVYGGRITPI